MTETLFRDDAYLRAATATVLSAEPRGVALDRTVFYPRGGGQPGDQGELVVEGGATIPIVNPAAKASARNVLRLSGKPDGKNSALIMMRFPLTRG